MSTAESQDNTAFLLLHVCRTVALLGFNCINFIGQHDNEEKILRRKGVHINNHIYNGDE